MKTLSPLDIKHLQRCIDLAREALTEGNDPFGSLITSADGTVLFEDYNRTAGGNNTLHPELAIAQWAAEHLSPEECATAIVYTSGEHCAMCSAAHAWAGLGKIVYAGSSQQLTEWLGEINAKPMPVKPLTIKDVVTNIETVGPVVQFANELREMHRQNYFAKNR